MIHEFQSKYRAFLALGAFLGIQLLDVAAYAQGPGCGGGTGLVGSVVYTHFPAHLTPVKDSLGNVVADNAGNWQYIPDIHRVRDTIETDVGIENLSTNTVTPIHMCTSVDTVCAAMEARVSPNGLRIAYAVMTAPNNTPRYPVRVQGTSVDVPIDELWMFKATSSEIWVYDGITGQSTRITSGHFDRMPDWASNDVLVFASDRAGTYAPTSTLSRDFYAGIKAMHIWRVKLVGNTPTEYTDLTPGEYFAMSPTVTSWGSVVYSGYEGVAPREFGTPPNHWWIKEIDINGNSLRSLVGAHGSRELPIWAHISATTEFARSGEKTTEIRGLRVVGEIHRNQLAVTNYYRGNSLGAFGVIFGWTYVPWEGENAATNYVPGDFTALTPYGQDQDGNTPRYHINGKAMGRTGHPAPWPDSWGYGEEAWMYTNQRGYGYAHIPPGTATVAAMGGEPTVKKEIRLAFGKRVTDPFDPTQSMTIACKDAERHCLDAQPVASYTDRLGIVTPQIATIEAPPQQCYVGVWNAKVPELDPGPLPTYVPPGKTLAQVQAEYRVSFQGNAVAGYTQNVTSFVLQPYTQWTRVPTHTGHASLLPELVGNLYSDGSALIPVPCGQGFMHAGKDADGNVLATGLSPMWTNGVMVCTGCHAGHGKALYEFLGQPPEVLFQNSQAYQTLLQAN